MLCKKCNKDTVYIYNAGDTYIVECQDCGREATGKEGSLDTHHLDDNKKNNTESNLITLCRPCHMKRHPRLSNGRITTEAAIKLMEGEG